MNKNLILIAALITSIACQAVWAKKAPEGMTEFNKQCPAPKLCDTLYDDLHGCEEKSKKACSDFVTHYKQLLPEYDCQRSFDSSSTEKYIVPAIWLCETHERFLEFLSKMKTKNAHELFGSEGLRDTLDGDLAEQYLKKSLTASKAPKKK